MNAKRILCLMLSLVMLLGMTVSASAEITGDINCYHQWAWSWPQGKPANCQEWKPSQEYCVKCGAQGGSYDQCGSCVAGSKQWIRPQGSNCQEYGVWEITCKYCGEWLSGGEEPGPHKWATHTHEQPTCENPGWKETLCSVCGDEKGDAQEIPALGHNWGEWHWAHEQPSCNTGAWQVRECKRCGRMEDRWVEGGNHNWGEWKVYEAPTCLEKGIEHRLCSICGDYWTRELEALGHEMGEWTIIKQPAAGENGLKERKCVRCEYTEQEEIPYTGGEIEYAFASLSKREASSPANGEFYILGETVLYSVVFTVPEGLTLSDVEITDPIKGNNEDAVLDIIPEADGGEYTYSVSHTVTETDIENGFVSNIATAYFFDPEGDAWVSVSSNEVTVLTGEDDNSAVILEKVDMRGPANGEYYVPGEVIKYGLTVRSDENNPLENIVIYDPLKGGDQIVFGPADTWVLGAEFDYTVTEADAQRGYIENTGYATFTYQNTGKEDTVYSNTLILPCGPGELPDDYVPPVNPDIDEDGVPNGSDPDVDGDGIPNGDDPDVDGDGIPNGSDPDADGDGIPNGDDPDADGDGIPNEEDPDMDGDGVPNEDDPDKNGDGIPDEDGDFGLSDCLTLVKTLLSTPANGNYFVPGEEVEYSVLVKNTGDALTGLVVSDWMWDAPRSFGDIQKGEDVTYPVNYTVTDADARAQHVNNIAQAEAVDMNGNSVCEYSNLVSIPCGFPDLDSDGKGDDPFGILSGLEVTKTVESLPLNGSYYTEGETVAYRITYTNTGELPLTDVEIFDPLFGLGGMASAEMLTPGESRYCFFDYVITGEDVARGYVYNQAIAVYMINDITATAYSNSVIVDTDGSVDTNPYLDWVYGEIIPPADGEPIVGEVDLERLYASGVCCSRTITYKDGASATYETAFCPKHLGAKASASMMMKAAITPEMQIQAASYASAIFRGEVEKMYQELISACDPVAKATVMAEYIGYQTELANYEALLKMADPEHPETAAVKISEMWEEKCVTMCIELHTAADARKDSLSDIALSAGNPASACECVIVSDENGKKAVTETYCPVHAFPFSMTDALLAVNDPSEAWALARQIWNIELTNAYNKMSEKTGVNKALVITEFQMLNQWMTAREAQLYALYPNEPEIVLETMVKIIMDRVSELCE